MIEQLKDREKKLEEDNRALSDRMADDSEVTMLKDQVIQLQKEKEQFRTHLESERNQLVCTNLSLEV